MRCPYGEGLHILKKLITTETDECVLWPYSIREGYGVVRLNGTLRGAHEIAWELTNNQSASQGSCIRHRCNSPSCVNPRHLFLETQWCPQERGTSIFLSMIAVDTEECVRWPYFKSKGYGRVKFKGKSWGAHVLSWMISNGKPVPKGLCVCHKCDITDCINPKHLFLGTYQDNSSDMVNKRRHRFGERHMDAKLTADNVREIRISKQSGRKLAKIFGVIQATISKVRTGRTWKSVL